MSKKKSKKPINTAMRVAIVSGIFLLFGSLCTVIGSLIGVFPQINSLIQKSGSSLFEIESENLYIAPPNISANFNDKEIILIPTKCWNVSLEDKKQEQMESSSTGILTFVISSSRKSLVTDIKVILDGFSAPVDESSFHEVLFMKKEAYGGPINFMQLGNITIGNTNIKEYKPDQESYQFEEDDAIRFGIPISFNQPGQFVIHIEITGRAFDGSINTVKSSSIFFGWSFLSDLSSKTVFGGWTNQPLQPYECK